jgi:hypothetical protein
MRKPTTPKQRLDRFLRHFASVLDVKPEIVPLQSDTPELPGVTCLVYRDIPKPGHITGVTYGLSEASHAEWRKARPELSISVRSTDLDWVLAVGAMATQLRGDCPFAHGDTVNVGESIAIESEMSAFFVFIPTIFQRHQFLGIDVGGSHKIDIAGLYPMYESELPVFAKLGLMGFWDQKNFDLFNVQRPRVELPAYS